MNTVLVAALAIWLVFNAAVAAGFILPLARPRREDGARRDRRRTA